MPIRLPQDQQVGRPTRQRSPESMPGLVQESIHVPATGQFDCDSVLGVHDKTLEDPHSKACASKVESREMGFTPRREGDG